MGGEYRERRFGDLTVRIARNTCIASENCVQLAPEVFELDDENIIAFRDDGPEIERERLTEACAICPVDALIVLDGDGKQLVP